MKWHKCVRKFFRYDWTSYKDHRETPEYQQRVRVVKTWWIWFAVGVLLLLQMPNTYGIIVAATLGMIFLTFAFLDEWRHFKGECDEEDE